jgi:DNA-directed RNA polymerase subunit alpha
MPVTNGFAMPVALEVDESTATERYARITAMPWEKGFGHTLGNALRRTMLSSLEGVAVSTVKIDDVAHEFSSMPDVLEDVTEIVLNIKKLLVKCEGELPRTLELKTKKAGAVTAADIKEDGVTTVLNPDLHICTLDAERPFRMEIQIDRGRGYRTAEANKTEDQAIGVIPVDSLFSPVERVRYDVEACRVGNITDYDRLDLEVWTDGRITPLAAVQTAAAIVKEHLAVFLGGGEEPVVENELSEEEQQLLNQMMREVDELELSVRAKNCLHNAGINQLGNLITRTEAEMLKFRNFGRKSLDEIKERLAESNMSLEMPIPENVVRAFDESHSDASEEEE